jgi:hypothetical protein
MMDSFRWLQCVVSYPTYRIVLPATEKGHTLVDSQHYTALVLFLSSRAEPSRVGSVD